MSWDEVPALYDVARQICHEFGVPWTDPRTGLTYPPPKEPPMTDPERDDEYRQLRERVMRQGEELIALRKEIEQLRHARKHTHERIEAIGRQLRKND
jgi:hypothetical protein